MKRYLSVLITFVAVGTSWAQQALWSSNSVISPEILPDNRVTFRLDAPKASNVEITGDFLPSEKIMTPFGEMETPGHAALQRNENGIWEYTVSDPLPSELYSYTFVVDSLRVTDPSNIHQLRDISTLQNIFIIPGSRGDLYSVKDVEHGTVSKVWYDSPTLGMRRRMTIYTPAGYERSGRQYPVLYLLHGSGGDENAWSELGRATQIFDNLIARGEMEPMIVVMTNGNASLQAAPGESPEGLIVPTTHLERNMEGSFETSFPEIVNYTDTYYRTIPKKETRAIAGLSMGGFHSLHISKLYPDMFDYVGLFSAAINPRGKSGSPVYNDMEGKLKTQFEKNPALYWIAIGEKDFLYDENKDFRKVLDTHGFPYEYHESADGHIWRNWRVYLSEFAPRLFRQKGNLKK